MIVLSNIRKLYDGTSAGSEAVHEFVDLWIQGEKIEAGGRCGLPFGPAAGRPDRPCGPFAGQFGLLFGPTFYPFYLPGGPICYRFDPRFDQGGGQFGPPCDLNGLVAPPLPPGRRQDSG